MTFSRSKFTTGLKLFGLVCVLTACSAGVDEEVSSGESNSQIHLNSLNLEGSQEEFNDALSPMVATDKNFTIKACLVDTALLLSLPGKQFDVEGKTITSDGSGCLRFNQKVELSYKDTKRFQTFKTIIKEIDSGESVTAHFAINPWDGTFVNVETHPNFQEGQINTLKSDTNEGFSVEGLAVTFGGFIGKTDGGAREATVLSKVNAYAKIPVSNGKALAGQIFKVTVTDSESSDVFETEVRSESNGLIQIPAPSTFLQHANNRWIKKDLTLEAVGGPFDGQIKNACYYINPWQTSGLFGWECTRGLPPTAPHATKSRLHLDTMKFNYMGNDPDGFRINNYLELSMVKSYLIELIPYVQLNHDFMGDVANRRIMSGRFKMSLVVMWPKNGQLALTPENKENFEFLTGTEKEVEVINGNLRTQVDLNFNFYDLPKASTRTMAVVKLESIDDAENLEPAIVSGPFISITRNFNSFLEATNKGPTEQKLDGLGSQDPILSSFDKIASVPFKAPAISPWRNMKGVEIFDLLHKDPMDGLKLKVITDVKKKTLLGMDDADVTTLLKGSPDSMLLRKLCPLVKERLIEPPAKYRSYYRPIMAMDMREMECHRTPEENFKVRVFKNIDEIVEQPKRVFSATDRMGVGVGFHISQSESQRVSDAYRMGYGGSLSAKVSIPFLDWISVGGGMNFDYSHTVSSDVSSGTGHDANGGRTRFMFAEELRFGFKARTTTCAIIEVLPTRYHKEDLERYKICDDEVKIEELEESYFYIGEDTLRVSVLRDQFSYDENQLIKLIRGRVNFERFFNLLKNEAQIIFVKKKNEIQSTNDYASLIYKKNDPSQEISLPDMAIPGVIELSF